MFTQGSWTREKILTCLNLMLSILAEGSYNGSPFHAGTVNYWRAMVEDVKTGARRYDSNPIGYYVIGLSPKSRRGQGKVADQFRAELVAGGQGKADQRQRSVMVDTSAVSDGSYISFQRGDSRRFGSVASRQVAGTLTSKQADGVVIKSLLERFNAALKAGDTAALPGLLQEAKDASDLTMECYIQQVMELVPECDSMEVTLNEVAAVSKKRRRKE